MGAFEGWLILIKIDERGVFADERKC